MMAGWDEPRELDIGTGLKKYRAIDIGGRWSRSYFEFWKEDCGQWREVRSWDSRERLHAIWQAEPGEPF